MKVIALALSAFGLAPGGAGETSPGGRSAASIVPFLRRVDADIAGAAELADLAAFSVARAELDETVLECARRRTARLVAGLQARRDALAAARERQTQEIAEIDQVLAAFGTASGMLDGGGEAGAPAGAPAGAKVAGRRRQARGGKR